MKDVVEVSVQVIELVRGALVPESSGSKSMRVSSTCEKSGQCWFVCFWLFKRVTLQARFMSVCRPLCEILIEMSPLLLCECCTSITLCGISSLCTGVLPPALNSTAKAGAMTIKLGHNMSTLAPFLGRRCLNHVTTMIYKLL